HRSASPARFVTAPNAPRARRRRSAAKSSPTISAARSRRLDFRIAETSFVLATANRSRPMTIDRDAVADEIELHRLIMRYAQAVDRRDGAAFVALFTPEAVIHCPGIPDRDTPEAIAKIPESLNYAKTYHTIYNWVVEIDGDTATSQVYT